MHEGRIQHFITVAGHGTATVTGSRDQLRRKMQDPFCTPATLQKPFLTQENHCCVIILSKHLSKTLGSVIAKIAVACPHVSRDRTRHCAHPVPMDTSVPAHRSLNSLRTFF